MYKRIMVPVDGSPTSNAGLNEAIRLAKLTQGRVLLMYAIDDLSFSMSLQASVAYVGDWVNELRQSGQEMLAKYREVAELAGLQAEVILSDDYAKPVHERIVDEALRWKADLIVIGTHGRRGVQRLVLGSSAEGVVRHSAIPVLLVRAPDDTKTARSPVSAAPEILTPVPIIA
jgi:nucleotide-binding universal stress UspA family protein